MTDWLKLGNTIGEGVLDVLDAEGKPTEDGRLRAQLMGMGNRIANARRMFEEAQTDREQELAQETLEGLYQSAYTVSKHQTFIEDATTQAFVLGVLKTAIKLGMKVAFG